MKPAPLQATETTPNQIIKQSGDHIRKMLRTQKFESQIACGTPLIQTYKYFVNTLNQIAGGLDQKVIKFHHNRFDALR